MGDVVGGITDVFFGNDKTEEAHQSGTANTMTPEQLQLLKSLSGLAQGGVDNGGEFYQGQRVAGPSQIQGNVFNTVNSLLKGANLQGAMQDTLTQPKQNTFNQQAVNKFYQDALYKPAMNQFMDVTAPAIQEKYVSQNALESGAYNRALTGAAGDMSTNLQGQLADVVYRSRENQLGRDYTANQNYLDRALRGTELLSSLGLTAGSSQRGIEQDTLTGDMNKFNEAQDYNNPYLQLALSLLDKQAFQPIVQGGYKEDNPGLFDFASGAMNVFTGWKKAGGKL